MTQFITLVLMSFGSYFTAPEMVETDENRTSITIVKGEEHEQGGNGNWDDE